MTDTVGAAIAKRDGPTAKGMIQQYQADFTTVLPSHVRPETWLRLAQGALKRGKKIRRDDVVMTELEAAALNNPGTFLAALLDAARQGLEPGTEQYYLTPRKVKGQLEILGITGYQGYIELMYRAGAVTSVVAECVYAKDHFDYQPGRDPYPIHEIDWDTDDRGPLRLVYAYAHMKDGAVSKVVVLNKAAIADVKAYSQGADSEYSPWVRREASMWLKSAVRQLKKWVPTSAEYRATVPISSERADAPATVTPLAIEADHPESAAYSEDVYDAEVVDEPSWPEVTPPGSGTPTP